MVDNILCPVSEYDPDVLEPLIGLAVIAAVNMSAVTKAVGAVVSESSGCDCPVMDNWSRRSIPELWMMDHAPHLRGAVKKEQVGELTVLTPNPRQEVSTKRGDQRLKYGANA